MRDWDSIYRRDGRVQVRVDELVQESSLLINPNDSPRVLDLGCGTGRHTLYLARQGFDVHGVDVSQTGLEITKELLKDKGYTVKLSLMDMSLLSYPDSCFDAIMCIHVLQHAMMDKIKQTLKEVYRTLSTGGYFILSVPSRKTPSYGRGTEIEPDTFKSSEIDEEDVPHHYFSKDEIIKLLAGYDIIKLEEKRFYSERVKEDRENIRVIARKK